MDNFPEVRDILIRVKGFLRWFFLLLGLAIALYGLKVIFADKKIQEVINQPIYLERKERSFFPDWSEEELMSKINMARAAAGVGRVTMSGGLGQGSRARLAVILAESDYNGSVTGVTREVAIKNTGFQASLVGDLFLTDFFKNNDPISYWLSDETAKETLLHPSFREVGIAIKNDQDRVQVYVLLVTPKKVVATQPRLAWGGPELWLAVNNRRVELGVNPLQKRDELCTIASIRLNQLLELKKLDGHQGFSPVLERSDLRWISEKYNVSEFLAQGYQTTAETVSAWENTLGHRALLSGGEYVWGCVYAQDSFAVAIAAY